MQLYYAARSPFARIVRVALIETGLDAIVQKQEVALYSLESTLLPVNPVGRVPTLILDDGTRLTESQLILNYIDTRHSGPKLLPRDGSDNWRTPVGVGDSSRFAGWDRCLVAIDASSRKRTLPACYRLGNCSGEPGGG